MFFRKLHTGLIVLALVSVSAFVACPSEDNGGNEVTVKPGTVVFWNTSGYKVDVYKNLNPENFDPSTLVYTLNHGDSKSVEQYPSYDQVTGDAFYFRYHVLLANSLQTGTTDIYAQAERVLSNITLVIKSNETYTKTISKPDELNFINGYIIVQNRENSQIQIIRGSTILSRMDNDAILISANSLPGYYEIPFSYFETTITMNQLKAFTTHDIPFPSFTMERGKKYTFTVQNDTVAGPEVANILH